MTATTEQLVDLLRDLQTAQAGSRAMDARVVATLGLADAETGVRCAGDVVCFRLRPTGSTDPRVPWLPEPTPTQSIDHAYALSQQVLGDEAAGLSLIIMSDPRQKVQAELVSGVFTEAATAPLAILANTVEAIILFRRNAEE